MSAWEKYKESIFVGAAFLGVLFLMWLFLLRGFAFESGAAVKEYDNIQEKWEKLNSKKGERADLLKIMYKKANEKLSGRIDEQKKILHHDFTEAEIPKKELSNRWQYVRKFYRTQCQEIAYEVETKRNIEMSDDAAALGMNIPEQTSETLEQDLTWLKQLVTIRRAMNLLLSVHEEADRSVNILKIHSIRPLPPEVQEPPLDFIREFPVEVEAHIRLPGLLRLLKDCGKEGDFHVIQSLTIMSSHLDRLSRQLNDLSLAKENKDSKYNKWYGHYYRVQLRLSTLMLSDPKKAKAGAKTNFGNKKAVAIKH